MLPRLRTIFGDRSVKFTSARWLTFGGGGPHCVALNIIPYD
jgi:hypothetical protein